MFTGIARVTWLPFFMRDALYCLPLLPYILVSRVIYFTLLHLPAAFTNEILSQDFRDYNAFIVTLAGLIVSLNLSNKTKITIFSVAVGATFLGLIVPIMFDNEFGEIVLDDTQTKPLDSYEIRITFDGQYKFKEMSKVFCKYPYKLSFTHRDDNGCYHFSTSETLIRRIHNVNSIDASVLSYIQEFLPSAVTFYVKYQYSFGNDFTLYASRNMPETNCFKDIEFRPWSIFNLYHHVIIGTGCGNNHISKSPFKGSKPVRGYKLFAYSYHGYYKKDLNTVISAANREPTLPPLTFTERMAKANEFCNKQPKSNNIERLRKYLCNTVEWYHGRNAAHVSPTLEYKKRWLNHYNWIIGSPALTDTKLILKDKFTGKKVEKLEVLLIQTYKQVESEIEYPVTAEFVHTQNGPLKKEVFKKTRIAPDLVNGLAPENARKKDYGLKYSYPCNCGKVHDLEPLKIHSPKIIGELKITNEHEREIDKLSYSEFIQVKRRRMAKSLVKGPEVTVFSKNRYEVLNNQLEPITFSINPPKHAVYSDKKLKTKKEIAMFKTVRASNKKALLKQVKDKKLPILEKKRKAFPGIAELRIKKGNSTKQIEKKVIFKPVERLDVLSWLDNNLKDLGVKKTVTPDIFDNLINLQFKPIKHRKLIRHSLGFIEYKGIKEILPDFEEDTLKALIAEHS